MILIFQIYYYRLKDRWKTKSALYNATELECEREPLLAQKDEDLAASHWRYTKALGYLASFSFVALVGVTSWILADESENIRNGPQDGETDIIEWKSQLLGYLSATLYRELFCYRSFNSEARQFIWNSVASRIPQISTHL